LLWGTIVLDEVTRTGPILILAGAGAAATVLAVLALARATVVADDGGEGTDERPSASVRESRA
jgi:hypothetical protein